MSSPMKKHSNKVTQTFYKSEFIIKSFSMCSNRVRIILKLDFKRVEVGKKIKQPAIRLKCIHTYFYFLVLQSAPRATPTCPCPPLVSGTSPPRGLGRMLRTRACWRGVTWSASTPSWTVKSSSPSYLREYNG